FEPEAVAIEHSIEGYELEVVAISVGEVDFEVVEDQLGAVKVQLEAVTIEHSVGEDELEAVEVQLETRLLNRRSNFKIF
ncbi:unnamed protein product, partial [Rotaria socialis]